MSKGDLTLENIFYFDGSKWDQNYHLPMGITQVLLYEASSPRNYLQLIRVEYLKSHIGGNFGGKIRGCDSHKSRLHLVTGKKNLQI